jgi:ligand-binding sensor domain-containing protein
VHNYNHTTQLLPDNRILCFYEDKKGRIWMGTWGNGLVIYDEESNTSEHFLEGNMVNSIIETSEGKIWIGVGFSANGLYEYNEEENRFDLRREGQCQEIKYDERENVLWLVGGNNSGLVRFDLRNFKEEQFRIEHHDENAGTVHTYQSIFIDYRHRIWVGTWGTGFYFFDPEKKQFERYLV